jgi:hypothetical protein
VFIAHAPSGYIMAVSLLERMRKAPAPASMVILFGVVGALAPDFDMSYFYLVDHRQTHHHRYVTHWPLLWLVLSAAFALWLRNVRAPTAAFLSLVFCLGGVLHLMLDTLVGDIWWFAPFVDRPYALFKVPAVFKPWWLNFLLHWSFAAELAVSTWAMLLYRRRSNASLRLRRPCRAAD